MDIYIIGLQTSHRADLKTGLAVSHSAVQKQNLHIDASVMILMVTAIVLMIVAMMCCPWMHTSIDFHGNDSTNYSKKDVPYYRPCKRI